ncbi:MAG TPA: tetratricopeptide repeat protein [Elusimicrobiota bacterium]|nr:tetratricopeptide repeat protein [Elusimicrobiota bacterium]
MISNGRSIAGCAFRPRLWLGVCLLWLARPGAAAPTEESYDHFLRGLIQERHGRMEEAWEEYENVLKIDPEATIVYEILSAIAMRTNRMDRALEMARKVVDTKPDDTHSYLVLGRVHLARGEVSLADEAFQRALEINPDDNESLLYAAHLKTTHEPEEALDYYRRYLKNNPDSLEAQGRIAEIHQRLGQLEEAEEVWKKILETDPNDFSAHLSMAHLYEVKKDTESVIREYQTCLGLDPENTGILMRLGELYFRFGDSRSSWDSFQKAYRMVPSQPTVNFWLALLSEEKRQWDDAIRHMTVVAHQNPEPSVMLRLSYYYGQKGDPNAALKTLKRLQKSNPGNPELMYYVAMGCEEAGRRREAIRWYEKVLRLKPNSAETNFRLGAVWDLTGKFSKAEPYLRKAVELDPNNAVFLNYLGYSWTDKNMNLDQAHSLIGRALDLEPDNGAYLDSMGWVNYRQGRLPEAESYLNRSTGRIDDPVVWDHYGEVLLQMGKKAEALDAFKNGFLSDPTNKTIARKIDEMEPGALPRLSARRLLKRVEGNFRQVSGLSGLTKVKAKTPGQSFRVTGLFYYSRPGLFRLEFLGPFFVPQALLVQNSLGLHWMPPACSGMVGDQEKTWLDLMGLLLSGELARRFDGPSVMVEARRSEFIFRGEEGTLRLGKRDGLIRSVIWNRSREEKPVELLIEKYEQVEGLWLPSEVTFKSDGMTLRGRMQFMKWQVNPVLDKALFDVPSDVTEPTEE